MNHTMKYLNQHIFIISFFSSLSLTSQIKSQSISVSGFWSLSIGVSDLQGGAGSDLNDTYTSAVDEVQIDVDGGKQNKTWAVYIERSDANWDSDFQLDAQAVHSKIIGGNRQEITTTSTYFFESDNSKNVNNIDVQLWLSGVSLSIASGTYSTTVIYTFVDI